MEIKRVRVLPWENMTERSASVILKSGQDSCAMRPLRTRRCSEPTAEEVTRHNIAVVVLTYHVLS